MKSLYRIVEVLFLIFLIHSCEKDKPLMPVVTTTDVTEISYTTAKSGGALTNNGGATITSQGICWNIAPDPTITNSKTADSGESESFISNMTQLEPNTLYYVRAYATNKAGTGYGNQVSFTTIKIEVPVLTTTSITEIGQVSALSGGNITDDKGSVIIFRGVCWGTENNPTTSNNKTINGTGVGNFTSKLIGLASNTTYYLRAYATNSAGTGYGNELSFKTNIITDIDGNIYNAVTIGSQIWMKENLKTTHYNDGTAIPLVTDNNAWINVRSPAYCWQSNDSATYKATYGALYNGYTALTGKLCPVGWHVPSNDEWIILSDFTGGLSGGGKLKEAGTSHWVSPNTGATNETGFTALPGGHRDGGDGSYTLVGFHGAWWTTTESGIVSAKMPNLFSGSGDLTLGGGPKPHGASVRCVKDN
jgi:uncharacterized protein (TIGR02145 family)